MPVGCHPARRKADNRPCRAEEPLGRSHVTGRAQHRVDEVPVSIGRPIQVAPAAMDLEGSLVSVLALTKAAYNAMAPPAQRHAHHGQQLRFPPPDGLMADGEAAQQHDLAQVPPVSACSAADRTPRTR
jgi:hypothetical protein